MKNKKLMIGSFIAGFVFFILAIIFNKNTVLFITFLSLCFILLAISSKFEKKYSIMANKKSLDDIAKNEEETKELIFKHKDDNNVLGFIYDVYNKEYEELNDILDNCPWEISYDYDEENEFYILSINNIVGKKKKEKWYIDIYSNTDGDSLVINDDDTSISNLTKKEILALLLKELRKYELPKTIDFTIRQSKVILYFSIIVFLIIGASMVVTSIFYAMDKIKLEDYIVIILALTLFAVLNVFSIIESYVLKIELNHDCLTYTNLFGKKKSCMALDIKYINIAHTRNSSTIFIYDHNDELIMKINAGFLFNVDCTKELSKMANWYHFKISL